MQEKMSAAKVCVRVCSFLFSFLREGFICLLLFCLFAGAAGCGGREQEYSSIVQVYAGEAAGSGVIYSSMKDYLIIVTAGHLQKSEETDIVIGFGENDLVKGELLYLSSSADVAFIGVRRDSAVEELLKAYTPAASDKESFDCLRTGDKLWLSGGILNKEGSAVLKKAWIYMEDFGQYMMLLSGDASPGMSGGGVFDEQKHFVGIICGSNEENEVAVLPLHIIEAEYLNWSLALEKRDSTN